MKYLIGISFLVASLMHAAPSENYVWAKIEWDMLFKNYQGYVRDYAKASSAKKEQLDIS